MDDRDLIEAWNKRFREGQTAMSAYQRVVIVGRPFLLGGVACVWTGELPYPVKLRSLEVEEAQADPGVGMWGVMNYPKIPTAALDEAFESAGDVSGLDDAEVMARDYGRALFNETMSWDDGSTVTTIPNQEEE